MRDNREVAAFIRDRIADDEVAAAGDERVRRSVLAKRQVVIRWETAGALLEDEVDPMRWQELSVARFTLGTALRDLAGEWADHPDYRVEWET